MLTAEDMERQALHELGPTGMRLVQADPQQHALGLLNQLEKLPALRVFDAGLGGYRPSAADELAHLRRGLL